MEEDRILIPTNKYQTPVTQSSIEGLPQEIQDQYLDFLHNVPYIRSLISENRPRACDLPRDEEGKIIIDITKPHIIEDSDYFRPTAIHYKETGRFTDLRPNPNPNSEFGKWIREEIRRCYEGYVRPSDGEWITGDLYFFLNYCPILQDRKDEKGGRRANRVVDFPKFWEGHYYLTHYLQKARTNGHHAAELASRGKGKSYLGASLLAKRFILGESREVNKKVQCVVTASEKKYLSGANQILDMFSGYIDFCAQNTQFPSKRLVNTMQNLQWTMGYQDLDSGTKKGTLNSVIGITSKDDESKLRGSRGVLYLIEEFGTFPRLLGLYNTLRPSVEDGENIYGLIFMYGCVCAGTKVWTLDGRNINVELLKKEDGIVGCTSWGVTKEPIGTVITPVEKECVHIKFTNGNELKCSIDHPILKQILHTYRRNSKRLRIYEEGFVEAGTLAVGDRICEARKISIFGNTILFDSRLVGMLIGDGSYRLNETPKFSSENSELLDYVKSRYSWSLSNSHITKKDNTYEDIRIKGITKNLKEIGIYGQTGLNKRLPINWETLTERDSAELIGGLYDTDGYIRSSGKDSSIVLTQGNKELLEQVQVILRKFGILSSITVVKPHIAPNRKDKKEWFNLVINGRRNILNFINSISLLVSYKKEACNSIIDWYKHNPSDKPCKYDDSLFVVTKVKSIERIGKQVVYNLSAMSSHTYLANNIITHNTAGDNESDFASAQEIMYNPLGYNMQDLPNVYDKEGQGRKLFTFFFPGYMNRAECYDKDGNSDVTKALLEILKDRYLVKYNSTDINSITKRIAEIPITPQEAILKTRGNLFPVTDLNERLNQLDNNPREFDDVYTGTLIQNAKGEVEFCPTTDLPIRDFPLKDNKAEGALEIFNLPEKNREDRVFPDRYIIGHDPVDDDESDTLSLTSTFVLDLWTDQIVAEYTGRKTHADDNFEMVRKLCLFYNAKCLYENNKKGIFAYFSRMNCTYLLADTPEYLKDKDLIKVIGVGNKAHPYSQIVRTPSGVKLWGDIKIGDILFGSNGTTCKVIDIPFDAETDIYEIELKDGRKVKASENHLWNVIDYTGRERIVTTKFIKDNGFRRRGNYIESKFYIPQKGLVKYQFTPIDIDPYFLGLMIGDGCFVHSKHNQCYFTSTEEDFKEYSNIVKLSYKRRDNRHWVWEYRGFGKLLDKYGLANTKSHTKFIPPDYKYNTEDVRINLLRGLLDTDGHIDYGGNAAYVTVSEKLCEDVLEIARSLGITCTCQVLHNSYGEYFKILFYTDKRLFNLPRKYSRQKLTKTRAFKIGIKSVRYIGREQAKCVTVDSSDHCYLIGDFVLTHNSKGVNATAPINNYANTLIRDWLLKPITVVQEVDGEQVETTIFNLYRIRNRALLKELILFNPDINVDRVRALGMVMLYREEKVILYQGDMKRDDDKVSADYLGNDPFFKINYDDRLMKFSKK